MYPSYTLNERIADGCVHIVGITVGAVSVIWLLASAAPILPFSSTAILTIYCLGMLMMFGFSAAYHLIPTPSWKGLLRRFDQAAIFFKIAATYTPFAFINMGGYWGYSLLSSVWIIALLGVGAKLFLTVEWERIFLTLYLMLGWIGLIFIQPLMASVPTITTILIFSGGIVYSVGVIFYVWEKLLYNNAIWHVFVLAGTLCHFSAVVSAVF